MNHPSQPYSDDRPPARETLARSASEGRRRQRSCQIADTRLRVGLVCGLLFPKPPLTRKEAAEQLAARSGEHARHNLTAVVEPRVSQQMKQRPGCPGFGIGCSIDDCRNTGLQDRT